MDEKIKYDDILYLSKKRSGPFLFQGIPCATFKAWNILGDKGIEIIHQQLAELLFWAKRRRGNQNVEDYGFAKTQQFLDLRTNTVFRVGLTMLDRNIHETNLHIPKNISSKIIGSLKLQDHYVIEVFDTLKKGRVIPKNISIESLRINPLEEK